MSFYDELSNVYDIVFKKDGDTVNFLKKGLKENSDLLDLACGTGTYSIELAMHGHNVIGIDLNSTMIDIAKEKDKNNIAKFYYNDMTRFKKITGDSKFDRIFCIGNSLVHLKDKDTILELMIDISKSLKKDGSIIIQIINYDRILDNDINYLPTIDRSDEGVKFIRNYSFDKDSEYLNFDTKLIVDKEGIEKIYVNSVPLLALRSNEITEILKKAGFSNIKLYGNFKGGEFTDKSQPLIIKAFI